MSDKSYDIKEQAKLDLRDALDQFVTAAQHDDMSAKEIENEIADVIFDFSKENNLKIMVKK